MSFIEWHTIPQISMFSHMTEANYPQGTKWAIKNYRCWYSGTNITVFLEISKDANSLLLKEGLSLAESLRPLLTHSRGVSGGNGPGKMMWVARVEGEESILQLTPRIPILAAATWPVFLPPRLLIFSLPPTHLPNVTGKSCLSSDAVTLLSDCLSAEMWKPRQRAWSGDRGWGWGELGSQRKSGSRVSGSSITSFKGCSLSEMIYIKHLAHNKCSINIRPFPSPFHNPFSTCWLISKSAAFLSDAPYGAWTVDSSWIM